MTFPEHAFQGTSTGCTRGLWDAKDRAGSCVMWCLRGSIVSVACDVTGREDGSGTVRVKSESSTIANYGFGMSKRQEWLMVRFHPKNKLTLRTSIGELNAGFKRASRRNKR